MKKWIFWWQVIPGMIRIGQIVERFAERLDNPAKEISGSDSWKELVQLIDNIETELCRLREAVMNHTFIDHEGWQETVLAMDQALPPAVFRKDIAELDRALEEAHKFIRETNRAHSFKES